MASMLRIATDIGGTFTDLVAFDEHTGELITGKASSTPGDFARGVMDSIGHANLDLATAGDFVHGCTVVINAITQRAGVRAALITTQGFRDVLAIGRGNRPDMYNLRTAKPRPFIPRRYRFEVRERVDFRGQVLEPLHLEDLDPIITVCRREAIEALAICFLHAYAHPQHEQMCRDYLASRLPGIPISISSDVTGEWREYERTSTVVLNAYVQPIVDRYLAHLETALGSGGMRCEPHVMQSNGGTTSFATARLRPIYLLESGPVSGVMGSAIIGQALGEDNVIALDIGGTTAKCALIEGGAPRITTDYKIEWRPDSPGYPVKVPVVDIVEIGAGGGSLAWFDPGGALRVGPLSAGADPGPACYGRGGTQATVTDAKLITGVIDPHYFLGGTIALDVDLARRAYAPIAERLGVSIEAAANGVIRLVDHHMINALKLISVRRGHDPRDFVLVASGGGGPMHAAALARELRVKQVIVPPYPGHFSAWSMLMIRPRVDLLRTAVCSTRAVDPAAIAGIYAALQAEATSRFADAPADQLIWQRSADMRYHGQEHTVKVPLPAHDDALDLHAIEQTFHAVHRREYTFALPDATIEFVTFHLTGWRNTRRPALTSLHTGDQTTRPRIREERVVNLGTVGTWTAPVYERASLPAGFQAAGPLIVEEPASTTLVYPDQWLEVDTFANLVLRPQAAEG